MVFASLEFLTLFLPLFLAAYLASPATWRNAVLLFGSWVFYGWWSPVFLSLFIALIIFGWVGGRLIDRFDAERPRRWIMAVCVALNLLVLCWYKYANILVETFNQALGFAGQVPVEWQKVLLPIGLSFIVLQSISYLVDVQRRTVAAERSFIRFGAWQAMFVSLIAGPIIRYGWIWRDLHSRRLSLSQFCAGAHRFMIGISMKVLIADTLAPVADAAFKQPDPSFSDAWIGCLAFSFQLFFDFAGYSAMAIGLGLMLGFTFPENFRAPYLARSIQDFWRRWHISLSSWFRDYLYIPLGGSRLGLPRTCLNVLIIMALSGLWHGGDTWNYLLWGLLHGLLLIFELAWNRHRLPSPPRWLAHVLTLLAVALSFTLFRSPDFATAIEMYRGQFGLSGWTLNDALAAELRPVHGLVVMIATLAILYPLLNTLQMHPGGQRLLIWVDRLWPAAALTLAIGLMASRGAVPFLYFQF